MADDLDAAPHRIAKAAWAEKLVGTTWEKKGLRRTFIAYDPGRPMFNSIVPCLLNVINGAEPSWTTLINMRRWLRGARRVHEQTDR